jgi:hypothetical protein
VNIRNDVTDDAKIDERKVGIRETGRTFKSDTFRN